MGAAFAIVMLILATAAVLGLWIFRNKVLTQAAYRGELNVRDRNKDPKGWERERLRRGRTRVAIVVIPIVVIVVTVVAGQFR